MAIKPISRDASVKVVWIQDPAIDLSASDPKAFRETMAGQVSGWEKHIKYHPDKRPTIFEIGVIPPGRLAQIEDECGVGGDPSDIKIQSLYWRCFLWSLRNIENGPTKTETDRGGKKSEVVPTIDLDGIKYVDPVWASCTFTMGLRSCATAIGSIAYRWNQLDDLEVK